MNRLKTNQNGFTLVEIVLVVVVIAIIGFLGWRLYEAQQAKQTTNQTDQSQQVPEVKSSDDLQEVEAFVNDTDINKELDTSEIDAALSE